MSVHVSEHGGHLPVGRLGEGHYGSNLGLLKGKYTVLLHDDFFLTLVKETPFVEGSRVYCIGDYGAADGAATMVFMKELLRFLEGLHGPDVEFLVVHEDRETNDFNSLFKRLHGVIPDPPSYLQDFPNVYTLASGMNFYKQCMPTDSMNLIVCMAAVHWLSGKPPVYPDSVYCFPGTVEDVLDRVVAKAAEDWEHFLLLRSTELKKGGLLVVSAPSDNLDLHGLEKGLCNENFLTIVNDIWMKFRDVGKITTEEFRATNLACYHKSLKMLKAPFENKESHVSKSSLRLISAQVKVLPCEFYNDWQKNDTGSDYLPLRIDYARKFVAAHRCWSNSAFTTGLSDSRSEEEKEEITNELYMEAERRVAETHPDTFKNDYRFSYIFIRKV